MVPNYSFFTLLFRQKIHGILCRLPHPGMNLFSLYCGFRHTRVLFLPPHIVRFSTSRCKYTLHLDVFYRNRTSIKTKRGDCLSASSLLYFILRLCKCFLFHNSKFFNSRTFSSFNRNHVNTFCQILSVDLYVFSVSRVSSNCLS